MKRVQLAAGVSIVLVGVVLSPGIEVAAKGGGGHGSHGGHGGRAALLGRSGGHSHAAPLRAGEGAREAPGQRTEGDTRTVNHVRNAGSTNDYLTAMRASQSSTLRAHSIFSRLNASSERNKNLDRAGGAFWLSDDTGLFLGDGVSGLGAYGPDSEFVDGAAIDTRASSASIYNRQAMAAGKTGFARRTAPGTETCGGFSLNGAAVPIQTIDKVSAINQDQRAVLQDLEAASTKLSGIVKQSCASEMPITPVARLDETLNRLRAIQAANEAVRGQFRRFYGLLTEEQKQQLAAIAGSRTADRLDLTLAGDAEIGGLCASQVEFTGVQTVEIASKVDLDDAQRQRLDKLKAASEKAADSLKASCAVAGPDTVDGRLDAIQKRIATSIQAIETIRPATLDFFTSLSDEQKAVLVMQSRGPQKSAKNN